MNLIGVQQLIDLYTAETDNFNANFEEAAPAMVLFDHFWKLVDDLTPIFLKSIGANKDPLAFTVQTNLYQLMKMDLLKGMLALTRGYITDSSFHTRRLLETSAVMIEMIKKAKKIPIYTTLETEKDREKYIEKFKIFLLVQNNLSAQSQEHYELLCFNVHPSAIAIGDRAQFTDNRVHELSAFDVQSEDDIPRLLKHYGLFVLMAFEAFLNLQSAFSEGLQFDKKAWNEHCSKFKLLWQSYAKSLIESGAMEEHLEEPDKGEGSEAP